MLCLRAVPSSGLRGARGGSEGSVCVLVKGKKAYNLCALIREVDCSIGELGRRVAMELSLSAFI